MITLHMKHREHIQTLSISKPHHAHFSLSIFGLLKPLKQSAAHGISCGNLEKYKTHFLDDFKYLWDENSEGYFRLLVFMHWACAGQLEEIEENRRENLKAFVEQKYVLHLVYRSKPTTGCSCRGQSTIAATQQHEQRGWNTQDLPKARFTTTLIDEPEKQQSFNSN
ncbi:hypothetical protein ACJX0J_009288 [Zea mays]